MKDNRIAAPRAVARIFAFVTGAGYVFAIAALIFWSFAAPNGGQPTYARDTQRANPLKRLNSTGHKLERATRKVERNGGEALAVHVLSVQSLIPEDQLLARAESVDALAPAAIVARVTSLSLDETLIQIAAGSSISQIVLADGVATTVAQTLLTRTLVAMNENARVARHDLADTDDDGMPNVVDDDVDGDGVANADDDDVDGDGMDNAGDDDVDGDHSANGDDADVDGDGSPNADDADDDGDGVDDDADSDHDGDGVDDSVEDEGNGNGNGNGNNNGNGNGNGNGNDNGNDNGNGNGNTNGNGNRHMRRHH